ncbi:MAG TPA: hypothetical protein VF174_11495 [Micromonosporaceae bacterium]
MSKREQKRAAAKLLAAAPRGAWLGATNVLGEPVLVAHPYPHICEWTTVGTMTGVQFRIWRRDCAACQIGGANGP